MCSQLSSPPYLCLCQNIVFVFGPHNFIVLVYSHSSHQCLYKQADVVTKHTDKLRVCYFAIIMCQTDKLSNFLVDTVQHVAATVSDISPKSLVETRMVLKENEFTACT